MLDLIRLELNGLYGSEVIKEMNHIIKLYEIYDGKGQNWFNDETDYTPTKKKTNYIKKLIKEEARFLFGKTPTFTIEHDNKEQAQIINDYIDNLLDKNLFKDKLIKAARDCFIGKRIAIKLHADTVTKDVKIMFVPSLEFVYEPFDDRVDELKKIIFFHQMNQELEKSKQIIWKQKYEMVNGKCILSEGFYNGNVLGTYLHGPLLSKNPELADFIITKCLEKKYNKKIKLKELNDSFEINAKNEILEKYNKQIYSS